MYGLSGARAVARGPLEQFGGPDGPRRTWGRHEVVEQVCNSFCLTKSLPKKGKKKSRKCGGGGEHRDPHNLGRETGAASSGQGRTACSEAERTPCVVQAIGIS